MRNRLLAIVVFVKATIGSLIASMIRRELSTLLRLAAEEMSADERTF